MKYTILSTEQKEDTLVTHVVFEFEGEKKELSIQHFRPETKEDVITGIENRIASEQSKLEAIAKVELVDAEIKDEYISVKK